MHNNAQWRNVGMLLCNVISVFCGGVCLFVVLCSHLRPSLLLIPAARFDCSQVKEEKWWKSIQQWQRFSLLFCFLCHFELFSSGRWWCQRALYPWKKREKEKKFEYFWKKKQLPGIAFQTSHEIPIIILWTFFDFINKSSVLQEIISVCPQFNSTLFFCSYYFFLKWTQISITFILYRVSWLSFWVIFFAKWSWWVMLVQESRVWHFDIHNMSSVRIISTPSEWKW